MSNTEQTAEGIKIWTYPENRKQRCDTLRQLASDAGIGLEFTHIPDIHLMNLDYDRYWMNVLAMAKIRELRKMAGRNRVSQSTEIGGDI